MATEKKDGHLYMFFKDENGTSHLRSRSKGVNGWNIKTGHVPHLHPFFNSLPNNTILLGEICFDGRGCNSLIIPAGGFRMPSTSDTAIVAEDENGNVRSLDNLVMNGGEVFHFVQTQVPPFINGI